MALMDVAAVALCCLNDDSILVCVLIGFNVSDGRSVDAFRFNLHCVFLLDACQRMAHSKIRFLIVDKMPRVFDGYLIVG
jgi:hypothetical protein